LRLATPTVSSSRFLGRVVASLCCLRSRRYSSPASSVWMLPLTCSGHLSAPWSPPPAPGPSIDVACASHPGNFHPRGTPAQIEAIHLLSIRLRRVKPTAFSGQSCYPCLFTAETAPPGLIQAPGSSHPSHCTVAGGAFWSVGLGWTFPSFHWFPSRRFSSLRIPVR